MPLLRLCVVLAIAFSCSPYLPLHAQTKSGASIVFTGAPAYSTAELLAASGLKPSSSPTQAQVEEAAQHLNDVGLFEEVTFAGSDKGIVFTLKPAPPAATLPARFSNFVWWEDAEIDSGLHARIPLYRSTAVPIAGSLRADIAAALQAMLAEKGVPAATVKSVPSSSKIGGPADTIAFHIDSPAVLIHSLTLVDTTSAMQPKAARVAADMTGQPWDQYSTYSNIASRIGAVYRNQGYLDIAVTRQTHSAPVVEASSVNLDLTAALNEGMQYRVSQLSWPGSELLSTADFNKRATLKSGDPDSPIALRESLASVRDAYGAKGFLAAKILASPAIDHTAHQVAYTVSVDPGSQYHLKSIHWLGVDPDERAKLDAAWHLKPGDIYDSTYFLKFLSQNGGLVKKGVKVGETQQLDATALTVDVTITFAAAPGSQSR